MADRVRLLELEELTAGYGASPTVRAVSLVVEQGEIVLLVGPNGAGKSTLLKAVCGQLKVLSGVIRSSGRVVTGMAGDDIARSGIGYVPQSRDVFRGLTVIENLKMGGYLLPRKEVEGRITDVVDTFPSLRRLLARRAEQLSGGERKLVGIARALMSSPKALLLDEPTAGLAPDLASSLLHEHIRGLADRGVGVLLVEQRAVAAMEISDFVHVLTAGAVILSGTAAEVKQRPDFGALFLGGNSGA